MQSETTPATPLQTILQSSLECSRIVEMIDEVLLLLSQKRRTLEEKAIAEYFHRIVVALSTILFMLHGWLIETDASEQNFPAEVFKRLQNVNENLRNRIEDLLKIVKYNLNHLEQYFEYDYCAKLIAEPGLIEELEAVLADLEIALSKD